MDYDEYVKWQRIKSAIVLICSMTIGATILIGMSSMLFKAIENDTLFYTAEIKVKNKYEQLDNSFFIGAYTDYKIEFENNERKYTHSVDKEMYEKIKVGSLLKVNFTNHFVNTVTLIDNVEILN